MTASMWLRVWVLASAFVFVASPDVRAQAPGGLSGLINAVFHDSVQGAFDNIGNNQIFNGFFNGNAPDTINELEGLLVFENGGFPIGSSSGGFTYFFDATTGAAVRTSSSFGPAFAERPLTSGRGKLNIGLTYLHRSFDKLEGVDLEAGSLKFSSPIFSAATGGLVDLIQSTLSLKVKNDTTTFFATYGLWDKLDVSVAVPVQRVSIDASISSQLVRFGPTSGIPNSQIPAFVASRSGSATGLGDIAVRAKYNVYNGERAAVAGGLDLRLPSGKVDQLLGTGNTRTKLYAAFASKMPRFFPHANIGYTFKSKPANSFFFFGSEVNYTAGAEFVVNPRLTVVGDVVGSSLADEGRLQQQSDTLQLVRVGSLPAVSQTVTELNFNPGVRLNTAFGTIGVKFNPTSTLIVSAHVLFPASNAGLRSRPTPVIGVDYTF